MAVQLFASDLDGTLLGKPDAILAFQKTWLALDPESRPMLCYNSGRLLEDTLELIQRSDLPDPRYLICGVGTVIYDAEKKETLKAFTQSLAVGWDLKKVESVLSGNPHLEKQPEKFQHPFKSSWYFRDASPRQVEGLRSKLSRAGLKVHVVYSSSRDLDVLPQYANKGNSLRWLLDHLHISPKDVIVAGDTGNDSSMFHIRGVRGIVPQNAQPELFEATVGTLTYEARQPFADGVLEGLKHYGAIQDIIYPQPGETSGKRYDPRIRSLISAREFRGLTESQHEYVEKAYKHALVALRKNITPMGFSACSIEDNRLEGTAENYGRVWARDGAIAVIASLSLPDEDIRACQRNTLVTLLERISPSGQIPANVSITDGIPDYSGTGGICSIDSGLWVIVAFYHFVNETKDVGFARQWKNVLQRAMDWLSAHDSNNDALLEIPEAGDWMDLFGRSYNILYDEVLWFYANLSYGRLTELLGEHQKATDYLRWAQTIRETLLREFWPHSGEKTTPRTFDQAQFSIGDASYLLAEVTPFGFDWRCDVYANILAVLFNVLDLERAKTVFRFMWGVGINEPYPVANLYPPVNAGDPDWRSYYTVNLLNLPHHYHNGGIWPFIGAQWVRFINRLGLREVAQRELYRLAQANQLGVSGDWQFNEWLHGTTGRPMGKAYQAWSAACFIQACQELRIV